MLVRTWNLFHGNTVPPGRVAFLEEAVGLACAEADILCLQELPVWASEYLDEWSGMVAVAEVAARPRAPRELGRRLTALNPGLLRSALTGQANAILYRGGLRLLERRVLVLNPGGLRLHRRVCQVVRFDSALTVANFHATNVAGPAEVEVLRAAAFLDEIAAPTDVAVLAGDFNTREPLGLEKWGFSAPGPGIDHVLVRGADSTPEEAWPEERRRIVGLLVSDHAPVEVRIS